MLKETSLDVEKRGLQPIDLDAPGGDFTIDVLDTLPGSQKKWRELTVSELRVWGSAGGAPENPAHMPKMAIGSLDGGPPTPPRSRKEEPPRGPFTTVKELCTAYDKTMTPLLDREFPDEQYPGRWPPPHCSELTSRPKGFSAEAFKHGPFTDARFVHIDTHHEETETLLLATEKGWSRTNVVLASRYVGDPGCARSGSTFLEGVTLAKTSTGEDVALVSIIDRLAQWAQYDPSDNGATTTERVYACRVVADGSVSCEGPKVAGEAREPLPDMQRLIQTGTLPEVDLAKVPWSKRRRPAIGPAGDLRLE